MRTPSEIHDLKAQWLADPCWDIEDTAGFEDHRDELQIFHLKTDLKFAEDRLAQIDQAFRLLKVAGVLQ